MFELNFTKFLVWHVKIQSPPRKRYPGFLFFRKVIKVRSLVRCCDITTQKRDKSCQRLDLSVVLCTADRCNKERKNAPVFSSPTLFEVSLSIEYHFPPAAYHSRYSREITIIEERTTRLPETGVHRVLFQLIVTPIFNSSSF